MITLKELNQLGFKEYSYNKYTHPLYFKNVIDIYPENTILDIFSLIYNKGLEEGKSLGYAELQASLRFLLNVTEKEDY